MKDSTFDVVVVGAGVGGMSAAVAAARIAPSVLLIESGPAVGGTGVHSPVALICNFFDRQKRFINAGVHREFFPHIYEADLRQIMTYDERELAANYQRAIDATPNLTVWCDTRVTEVNVESNDSRRIQRIVTRGGYNEQVAAAVFVDSTADGNLAALAGAEYAFGRDGDGRTQPATLTFKVVGVDFGRFQTPLPRNRIVTWDEHNAVRDELTAIYRRAKAEQRITGHPREDILFFPYPTEPTSLLFNQTRILGVDPTDPRSVERGLVEGRRQGTEVFGLLKAEHPAFADARIEFFSKKLGVREGRRIIGDYVLTGEDCLTEARFDDMVAAAGYQIDIHSPDGEGTILRQIPGSGYYHIPYRCLCAKGFVNLLLGSRCISGTHEAHSSYRVMPSVSAIGQAAGTAGALCAAMNKRDVCEVSAAQVRFALHGAGQFVEGALESYETPGETGQPREGSLAGGAV